jgi:hypothetical protein
MDIYLGNLYDKDEDGNYLYQRQILAFELFASTKTGKEFLSQRAQEGFEFKGAFVKGLEFKAEQAGDLSSKVDANFKVTDLDSYEATKDLTSGALGLTEAEITDKGKLSVTYHMHSERSDFFQKYGLKSENGAHEILNSVDTWAHETLIHGYAKEQNYRLRHFVNMANMAKCSKLGEIIPKTMEQRFKSLSLFEFQERFSNAADCLKYLADEKWGNGFVCRKCGHTHSCAGKATQSRQCTCCRYVESPTAQTLFHKVKFDLLKAFYIVYFVSTNKKGITSTELSRKLNLRQKTCWGFKRKVMKAMESSENHPIEGDVEVDETVFGGQEENTKGRKNINKKLVVLAIEKKNKGVSRLYARVIPNASAEQLGGFMKAHIDPKAKITTDKWTGYIPLKADFENLTRVASGKKGSNFPELHRVVMNLKSWLRGVHHHVNDLQDYLNEYCYRFNRSFMKENIFDNLMKRMIEAEPCYIKNISQ